MSRYFKVLERAARNQEFGLEHRPPPLRSNIRRPAISPDGLLREEFSKLVQRFLVSPAGEEAPCAVLFCGIEQGEGSSRICARAGQMLSQQGDRAVCLVDANLRSPILHQYFSADNRRGLTEALREEGSAHDFAMWLPGASLWLVPSGTITPEAHTRLGGEGMQRCLSGLRAQFDHVLIDAPPASLYSDAPALGRLTDGVVLVVEAGSTRRETAWQVKDNFESAHARLLGTVLDQRTFPIPEAIYKRL